MNPVEEHRTRMLIVVHHEHRRLAPPVVTDLDALPQPPIDVILSEAPAPVHAQARELSVLACERVEPQITPQCIQLQLQVVGQFGNRHELVAHLDSSSDAMASAIG
jgi:hypothetical protein